MSLDMAIADLPQLGGGGGSTAHLTGKEKAAIVVRLLLTDGAVPALSALPEARQTELAVQLARMNSVDTGTVEAVAEEFAQAIEAIGLSFPSGLDAALGLLDGMLSDTATTAVRRMAPQQYRGDPWDSVHATDPDRLLRFLESEAVEVAAVILAKLKVETAAQLLGRLPGERARKIALAVSKTANVTPECVRRIGISLAEQLAVKIELAFTGEPVGRVGEILNFAPAAVRDRMLAGFEADDADFAARVRRAIFTFADIPARVTPRDIAKLMGKTDQADIITALAGAQGKDAEAAEFILSNISQRLAENLRGEAAERSAVSEEDREAAMLRITGAIREMANSGDIVFIAPEE